MSDYTKTVDFAAKDALTTGDSAKVIKGTEHDTEFNNIATAIATKYDSNDLASAIQAEAETLNTVLITPLRLANWADQNGGIVGELIELADPGADRIFFWDDGEAADANVAFLTVGNGLEISTTTLGIADQSVSTTVPIKFTSGTLGWDSTSISEVSMSAVSQSAHGFLLDHAGALKVVPYDQAGIKVQTGQGTQTLAITDANTLMQATSAATITIPLNSSVAFDVGTVIILNIMHASAVITVTAAASVTLVSVNHPAGVAAASDTVNAGGSAALMKIATDTWILTGDISD
jgi:hypothetical protein